MYISKKRTVALTLPKFWRARCPKIVLTDFLCVELLVLRVEMSSWSSVYRDLVFFVWNHYHYLLLLSGQIFSKHLYNFLSIWYLETNHVHVNRPPPFQNRPANFPLVGAGPKICPQNLFWRHRSLLALIRIKLYEMNLSNLW